MAERTPELGHQPKRGQVERLGQHVGGRAKNLGYMRGGSHTQGANGRHYGAMEDTPNGAPRRPRKGWQRVMPRQTQPRSTRETFRRDAPSPAQEILAKHDAELDAQAPQDEGESTVICF